MASKLNTIFPEWVQRGASMEVIVEGDNLSAATNFIFNGAAGLSATVSPPTSSTPTVNLESSGGGITLATGRDPKKFYLKITVAPDAPLGARELRFASPGGISNPLTVTVGDKKEELEKEPNNSTNEAQVLTLPLAINGHIHAASEVDLFRFAAKKGERLIFDLMAARAGSPLDSSLSLLDRNGKELARSEDVNSFDSLLDYSVPEDGDYFLQVRDFRFQGGANYKYRIAGGVLPYIDAIFPYGGQRGQTVEVKLIGRNLEETSTLKLQIASSAPLGPQDVRANTSRGYSNPARFDVSALPEFLEAEPNEATNTASAVNIPGVFNGRIEKEKDEDFFKFKAEKGQRLIFEVLANRFGSPLDAVMTILGTNGAVLQRNDDAVVADARIDQTFPEAGEYWLSIRDLLDRGGERFGYRVTASPPPGPDFSVKFSPDVIRLYRGGRIAVKIDVTRSAGFAGGVEIVADGLPEGVSAFPLLIVPEAASGLLFLSASDSAALGHAVFKLKAFAPLGGKRVERTVGPVAGREGFLSVFNTAPFTLDPFTLSSSVEQNQSTSIEVAVNRRSGFSGDIKLTVEGLNLKNIDLAPVTSKSNETKATLTVKPRSDADVGPREVYIKGDSTVEGVVVTQVTRPIPFNVLEFPFVLVTSLPRLTLTALPEGTKSAASEAEFSVKATRKGLFSEEITLTLEGLPEGVTATKTNLGRNVSEVLYKLTATDKAKVNTTNTITVAATSTVNGRTLTHKFATLNLLINPPTAEVTATNVAAADTKVPAPAPAK